MGHKPDAQPIRLKLVVAAIFHIDQLPDQDRQLRGVLAVLRVVGVRCSHHHGACQAFGQLLFRNVLCPMPANHMADFVPKHTGKLPFANDYCTRILSVSLSPA